LEGIAVCFQKFSGRMTLKGSIKAQAIDEKLRAMGGAGEIGFKPGTNGS
jgi:hypothetical protein